MDESSGNGLTPPGGPVGPTSPEPAGATPPPPGGPSNNPYFANAAQPPIEAGDKGLGWTAFGTALGSLCVSCLPLVAVVLSVITLARKRFQPRWVPIVALVLGAVLTVGQALLVPSFLDGIKEGIEEEAKDRSGDTVTPMALQKGDCVKDGGIADLVEAQESETEHVV